MKFLKHIGMLCIFSTFVHFSKAQTCEQYRMVYPFLNCEKNGIIHKGRSLEMFGLFYEKLSILQHHGLECLNILHFGDSHIQADYLPNRMRHLLWNDEHLKWAKGARGLIFPFSVAKTDNPHNYKVDYSGEWSNVRCVSSQVATNLGLMGITISTDDPTARLKISQPATGYATNEFTRIRVLHSMGKEVPKIRLKDEDNVLHSMTSEIYGYTLFLLKKPTDSLTLCFEFEKEKPQKISIYGISLENDEAGFTYSAIGVNGATVKAFLKSNLLAKQLPVLEPSLIILSLGINDMYSKNTSAQEFETNYTLLIRRIRKTLPNVPILLTTPGDALRLKTHPIREFPEFLKAIERVAENNHCAIWDFYTIMGGKGSINAWHTANLARNDKLHFVKKGYELQAELLFQALIQSYLK